MTTIRLGARKHGNELVGGVTLHIDCNAGNLDALEGKAGVTCAQIFKWTDTPGQRVKNICTALACLNTEGMSAEEIEKAIRPADLIGCEVAMAAEIKEAFSHEETLNDSGEVDVGLQEIDAKKTEP